MFARSGAIILVLILTLLLSSCGLFVWQEYSSAGGSFAVQFPGKPEQQTDTIATAVGEIELITVVAEGGKSTAYFAAYSDYPPEIIELSGARRMLENSREIAIKSQGATLLREHKIALGGNPGLEFVAEFEIEGTAALLKARSYLVRNRLFQTSVLALEGAESLADIDRFLKSFRLLH